MQLENSYVGKLLKIKKMECIYYRTLKNESDSRVIYFHLRCPNLQKMESIYYRANKNYWNE